MTLAYKTIAAATESLFKDRGSRFLGFAYPVNDVDTIKKHLQHLKELHPKAVHHCYAFRLGTDGTHYRAVDDGEPSGSAGKPVLGQIDSFEITNILIVVVRYFGGTLLGVPGLINAYKTAAQEALIQTAIIEKDIEKPVRLSFGYPVMNEVMTALKQYGVSIQEQDMQLFCEMTIGIPLKVLDACMDRLRQIYPIEIVT